MLSDLLISTFSKFAEYVSYVLRTYLKFYASYGRLGRVYSLQCIMVCKCFLATVQSKGDGYKRQATRNLVLIQGENITRIDVLAGLQFFKDLKKEEKCINSTFP